MEPQKMGSIRLALSSDAESVADTKAGAVDCSDFLVDIYGTTSLGGPYASLQYVYGTMPEQVMIPFGSYRVSAQSCTETAAEEGNGKVRYWGESVQVDVVSYDVASVSVKCRMVNGKASMTFDQGFLDDFADVTVTFTMGERTVTLTSEQANAQTEVYFNVTEEGGNLTYSIKGTVDKGGPQQKVLTYTNTMRLLPAKWARITIKSNHNGVLGPDISVNDDMSDESFTEVIDPEGGDDLGNFSGISILADSQIDDATVVDCVLM